jgi:hypothetical protein
MSEANRISYCEVCADANRPSTLKTTTIATALLGSAVTFMVLDTVQAADLPIKAKAVEYVRICSLYGAGFWYIPGTDTCIKIGGYLRVNSTFNGNIYNGPAWSGDLGQGNRFGDRINSRSRMGLTVDTRTATEYGVVRTFAFGGFQFNNFSTSNPTVLGAPASTLAGLSGSLLNSPGGGYVEVEFVFLQFAGFTFGKSASAYATPWHGYPGNNGAFLIGGHDTVTGVDNIQYSAQFGNGVSATVGLDDPTVFNRTPLYNLALGVGANGFGTNAYGGWHMPDVVGNIRIDQTWGLFQISGAVHEVDGSYNLLGAGAIPLTGATAVTDSILSGHPETKYGGSVMAALNIKNIPTGENDDIKMDASRAKGDTKNVISTSAASPSFAMLGGVPGQFGPDNSYGFGATSDGVYLPVAFGGDGAIHLTESFGFRAGFNHNWDAYWSSGFFGAAGWVRYDGTAKAEYCAAFGASHPGMSVTYTCDPNFNAGMVGMVTRWTPIKNLTFSGEVLWFRLHQNFNGFSTFSPGAPQPVQALSFHDQDTVAFDVRVQRNF